MQTKNIRGQVVSTLSITIHTNVYKISLEEPKQAEADHAIANNACHRQMFRLQMIAASQCSSDGGTRNNTILNEFLQDGQNSQLRPGV